MNDNNETRRYNEIVQDNIYLREQLRQARITIANLERANKVAAQIDSVKLKSGSPKTKVYQR